MDEASFNFSFLDGTELEFQSPLKLKKWLESERDNWSWLAEDQHFGSQLFRPIRANIQKLIGICDQFSTQDDNPNLIRQAHEHKQALQNLIDSSQFVPSGTDFGNFILNLAREDVEAGVDTLRASTFNRKGNIPNDGSAYQGLIYLTLYRHGFVKKSFQASKSSITKLLAEIETAKDEYDRSTENRLASLDAMIALREEKVVSSTTSLAKTLRAFRNRLRDEQFTYITEKKSEFDSFIEKTRGRVEGFEDFYENKVALLEPVSYWRRKKGWHVFGTIVSSIVFFGYCAMLAYFIGQFIFAFNGGVMGFIEFWRGSSLAALGAIALLLTLLLILARIFYRIFASQLHLWNDASERVTMTQTYLAFAEKELVKDEHLSAVLTRLFAPASDGVVKDDFGSVGPVDALLGRLSR